MHVHRGQLIDLNSADLSRASSVQAAFSYANKKKKKGTGGDGGRRGEGGGGRGGGGGAVTVQCCVGKVQSSLAEAVSCLSELLGRMKPLPTWLYEGAILGVQGGTQQVGVTQR